MKKRERIRCLAATFILSAGVLMQPLTAGAWVPTAEQMHIAEKKISAKTQFYCADYAQAEAEYTELIRLVPSDFEMYLERAEARIKQENYEGAFQDYRQAYILTDTSSDREYYHDNIAMAVEEVTIRTGDYALAVKCFEDIFKDGIGAAFLPGAAALAALSESLSSQDQQLLLLLNPQLQQGMAELQGEAEAEQAEVIQQGQQLKAVRTEALASLNQTITSESGRYKNTIQYEIGGKGVLIKENRIIPFEDGDEDYMRYDEIWASQYDTYLYMLSEPLQSINVTKNEVLCYVPAGTQVGVWQSWTNGLEVTVGWSEGTTVSKGQKYKAKATHEEGTIGSRGVYDVYFIGV